VRLLSVLSFSGCLFFYLLFKKTPKKVVVQSPPLLLSFISVLVLSLKKKKIILNISDLWPLAAIELKALKKNSLSHKFSLFFERFIYKKATVILGQSNEIIKHVQSIFAGKECHLYRNYPDHKLETLELNSSDTPTIKIFYAGLLGIAQGVLEMCKKINMDGLNLELHLFGDGTEKLEIMEDYMVSIISLSKEELAKYNYQKGDTDNLANLCLSIKGMKAAIVFTERDGIMKISFRSKGKENPVNIELFVSALFATSPLSEIFTSGYFFSSTGKSLSFVSANTSAVLATKESILPKILTTRLWLTCPIRA
jgi:hypothetical protein